MPEERKQVAVPIHRGAGPFAPSGPVDPVAWRALQDKLPQIYRDTWPKEFPAMPHHGEQPKKMPRHVVICLGSISFDSSELVKIPGVFFYEERLLFMLLLLRHPSLELVLVTSHRVDDASIAYFLSLLPGVYAEHARRRLHILSCYDIDTSLCLSEKLLLRPRMLERIRSIVGSDSAHISPCVVTEVEQELAIALGVPIYGTEPSLPYGVPLADGAEDLNSVEAMVRELRLLKERNPSLRKAVIKYDEGFSGKGNAMFKFEPGYPSADTSAEEREAWILTALTAEGSERRFKPVAHTETWAHFSRYFSEHGGIIEAFLECADSSRSAEVQSPSVQCRIAPDGEPAVISTHDQLLDGQTFLGCIFPAQGSYRQTIIEHSVAVCKVLASKGVIGRFGIDFMVLPNPASPCGWDTYAVEINLRKGGTTHPFDTMHYLVNGAVDPELGIYRCKNGVEKVYLADDNMMSPCYRSLSAQDILDILVQYGVSFNLTTLQGVVILHLGCVPLCGKLGVVCIANSVDEARAMHALVRSILDTESACSPACQRAHGPHEPHAHAEAKGLGGD